MHQSYKNHFLIAMPTLQDPFFSQSVCFLLEHNEEGATGIIINRPLEISLNVLFSEIQIQKFPKALMNQSIFFGGPVNTFSGSVLHSPVGTWNITYPFMNTLGLTISKDILEAISEERGPEQFMMLLGFSGWESGQVEKEIKENAWLVAPFSFPLLFDVPIENRWKEAAQSIGVNLSQLTEGVGHA